MDSTGARAPATGGGGTGKDGPTTRTGGGRGAGGGKGRGGAPQPSSERVGPRQYLAEVRGEMRKVAWPPKSEIINSSLIVLVAVTIMTTLIFGFDYASAKIVLFLFN
jgi:preprotein translocase subunit SecE